MSASVTVTVADLESGSPRFTELAELTKVSTRKRCRCNGAATDPWQRTHSSSCSCLLGLCGISAAAHIPKLIETFHDESSSVRRLPPAVGCLRDVVTAEHVESVVSSLADPDNAMVGGGAMSVRRAALLAFTGLCKPSADVGAAAAQIDLSDGAVDHVASHPEQESISVAPSPSGGDPALQLAVLATTTPSPRSSHEDPDPREMAVRAMIGMGAQADITGLIGRLQDEKTTCDPQVDALCQLRRHVTAHDHLAHHCPADEREEEERRAAVEVLAWWQLLQNVPEGRPEGRRRDEFWARREAVDAASALLS